MKELVEYLVDLYTTTLAPKISQVITSGFQFFRLIDSNPEAAAQHAGSAIVTIFGVVLATFLLVKAIVGLSKTIAGTSKVIGWLISSVVEIAGKLRIAIQSALLTGFPKLFTAQPYRALIYWASMMDTLSAQRMATGYKDGPTQVLYQLNMGFAVLMLCAWSSLAFAYAVFAAGSSFDKPVPGLAIAAVLGGALYGALILGLDRSIIAPYTRRQTTNNMSVPLGARLQADLYEFFPNFVKLAARVGVAIFVAGFTALPLTMLVLQGGIADQQTEPQTSVRTAAEKQLRSTQDARRSAIANRWSSRQCQVATQAVSDSQRRIDDMARSGCKDGRPTCPREGTHYFETMHKGHVENQKSSCLLSPTELQHFDAEVARLTAIVAAPPQPNKPADILQGAIILEKLAVAQESNKYFKPVTATFYLLFIVELIPLLMKLWREPLIDQRRNSDRRASSGSPQGPERRQGGRRSTDFHLVDGPGRRAA